MTLLDCVREEMKHRGMSDQQCNSKAVAAVLDIVTKSGDKYTALLKDETAVSDRLASLTWSLKDAERKINLIADREKQLEQRRQQIEQETKDAEAVIYECETPEGRDTMRAAQLFLNSVEADSNWDNKYYISGLAAILSRGNVPADMPRRKEEE